MALRHKQNMNCTARYRCDNCDMLVFNLKRHNKTCSARKCSCGKTYKTVKGIKEHKKQCFSKMCDICDTKYFATKPDLLHCESKGAPCRCPLPTCQRYIMDKKAANHHRKTCLKDVYRKDKDNAAKVSVIDVDKATEENRKLGLAGYFYCKLCRRSWPKLNEAFHMKQHADNADFTPMSWEHGVVFHKCNGCSKKISALESEPFAECKSCNLLIINPSQLPPSNLNAKSIVAESEKKSHKCHVCSKCKAIVINQPDPLETEPNDANPFQCPKCVNRTRFVANKDTVTVVVTPTVTQKRDTVTADPSTTLSNREKAQNQLDNLILKFEVKDENFTES